MKKIAATLLLSTALVGAASAQGITEFRIGLLGGENAQDRLASNECFRAYTEEALGVPTRLFTPADYNGVIQGLIGGSLDLAWLGASAYAAVWLNDPEATEPVLVKTNLDGSYMYYSVAIARADSGIRNFEDLKGKRVNIGNPGSGQRGTMDVVLQAMGWSTSDFAVASELPPAEQALALCDNNIDAMVYTVGHPSGAIQEATTACDTVLVNVTGPAIDGLVADNPFYRVAVIPGGMYRGTDADVTTFGVGATFISGADVPEEVVYHVTKAIFSNLDQFKSLHPALGVLDPAQMVSDGNSAPLHDGAVKYYKEKGWM